LSTIYQVCWVGLSALAKACSFACCRFGFCVGQNQMCLDVRQRFQYAHNGSAYE